MRWYGNKRAEKLPKIDRRKIIVLDTETTGLRPKGNDILQLTILDGTGDTLFHSYIRPTKKKSWKSAQKVNGITKEMVQDAPIFPDVKNEVQKIMDKSELIVGYNINFDLNFLHAAGILTHGKVFDVMYEFARFCSAVDGTVYRTCKLTECAAYFSYPFSAHDSMEDTRATLHCFEQLIDDSNFITCEKKNENSAPKSVTKTKITLEIPTRKRKNIAVCGFWSVILGELMFLCVNGSLLTDFEPFISLWIAVTERSAEIGLHTASLLLVLLGVFLILVGIVKMIIMLPRWIGSRLRRIWNRIT